MNDIDNGVGYACAGIGALENLYLHLNFFCKSKAALKNKLYI